MSETKFTKGEWSAEVSGYACWIGSESGLIAHLDNSQVSSEEEDANAHLIAAAPEMYEMLERCKKAMFKDGFDVEDIENLLAKARGENT